jgi:NosR/NirI family nitrous oxide reductase transcriptional regulator
MVNKKRKKQAGLYHYLLFLLLMVAVGLSSGWEFVWQQDHKISLDLNTIKKIFPKANEWDEYSENVYSIRSNADTIAMGILVRGKMGYGGKVPLFIGMENEKITKILLLANNETPEFIEYIREDELLGRWSGMNVNQVSKAKIDAVSGATESSNAIINGVRHGAALFLNEEQSQLERPLSEIVKDLIFLAVILLSLFVSYSKKLKKYRWVYLIIVLLVFGIYTGKLLSLKLLYGWLSNGIAWETNWQSIILLVLALAMPLIKRPHFYCNYLCPMGAFQELINKISPAKKQKISLKVSKLSLSEIYLTLILVSLVLGFQFELSKLEPFMVFLYQLAGIFLFAFVLIIALMSFFFNKPWCSFCPTGCIIDKVHNN